MKIIKILLIILVVVLILGALSWYFTSQNPDAITNTLAWWANRAAERENWTRAIRLYSMARNVNDQEPWLALKLAEVYQSAGNYTKTEYTLTQAIQDMPDETELYCELCRVYVRQDKLMDAVDLLSGISSTTVRERMAQLRPAPPVITPESGSYDTYIPVTVSGQGDVYVSATGEYPSIGSGPCTEAISLSEGNTTITALSVGSNGLVSDVSAAVYTVGSVIRQISFTDPALEAYVRQALEKDPAEGFTTDELWAFTSLTLPEGMATLADLTLFERLESLTVQDLSGVDLMPLGNLTGLHSLSLTGCRVTDEVLEALGTLTGLTSLGLKGCSLTTLMPLSNLEGLTWLDVSDNAIGNLEPLKSMSALTWLDVSNNAVTDLTPLAGLQNLRLLNGAGNPLESLDRLPAGLASLDVSNCGLRDLSALQQLVNLDTLAASGNGLNDLRALGDCLSLRTVDVSNNGLVSLYPVQDLPALETLRAGENELTSLPDFPEDSILTNLEVPYNQIEDLSGLSGLMRLNYLDIDYNLVSDLTPLSSCWALVQVTAYGCPILVSQATRLTETGVIVRYSPDYTAEDPGKEAEEPAAPDNAPEEPEEAGAPTGETPEGLEPSQGLPTTPDGPAEITIGEEAPEAWESGAEAAPEGALTPQPDAAEGPTTEGEGTSESAFVGYPVPGSP